MILSAPPSNHSSPFRTDINGIRAWAVLAVVLYHFNIPGFSGGFVGVDIFFVISGFLMTGIVVSALEDQQFSLWHFYLARARRIIPALLALCAVLLALGWFYLANPDYRLLGKHTIYAISFLSNSKFSQEDGYFDAASHEKWLLHTWSLSVEWQFYLLLPIILLFIWRWRGKAGAKWTLVVTCLASFSWSVHLSEHNPVAAFYLLPSRAWEMLAGGLTWWFSARIKPSYLPATWIEFIGFLLILLSIALLDNTMTWPGGLALLPAAGTIFILAADRQNSLFTANRLAQWLGTRSYSIYLWHWPLVVVLHYVDMQNNIAWISTGLASTFILGEISYRLIEGPARIYFATLNIKSGYSTLGTVTLLFVIIAGFIRHQDIPNRVPARWEAVLQGGFKNEPDGFNTSAR